MIRFSEKKADSEFSLGFGNVALKGKQVHSGGSVSVPMLFYIWNQIAFELRPVYSNLNGNEISDTDISIISVLPFSSLRIGHRWLNVNGESLNAYHVGVSFQL
ncbi:MAG: hypothetical protein GY786_16960 [Proteobacteria bacterium]|nr:hypothetical protein [Pseudomonadota bacterium]